MGFSSPNHTQTPNDIFDKWLPKLSFIELKVLLVIIRKTLGWHKTRDRISLSQISDMTGSSQTSVIQATLSLEILGLIKKEVLGKEGFQQTFYELILDDSEDLKCSNNSYPSSTSRTPLLTEETPPLLAEEGQKKLLSKEKIKERSGSVDPPPPEIVCKREKFIEVAPKVKLTEKQTHELIKKYGKQDYENYILKLSGYKIKTNKITSSDYRAILKWVVGAVHNEKQDVVIKQRIKESNLKGLQEIYAHLVRIQARGDLRWNDKNGIVQDLVLNRTANLDSSKLLSQVANWYNLTWEEEDGN